MRELGEHMMYFDHLLATPSPQCCPCNGSARHASVVKEHDAVYLVALRNHFAIEAWRAHSLHGQS